MADKTETVIKANCPKCKQPAAKLGLSEIIQADGSAEAYWTFLCVGCDCAFDVPKLPLRYYKEGRS